MRIGDIYDSAKVVRVDRGSGLLLEVTSSPESTPTFVSVSFFSFYWRVILLMTSLVN